MAAVVATNAPLLKERGFRKRRHPFNRTTSDGLMHVVNLWMAPFEPKAWTEVPGLRKRHYGTFRLDFGVWAAEMTHSGSPKGDWVNEYDCQLQRTIGQLQHPDHGGDFWWPLDDSAAGHARQGLIEHGLPWLDQFRSKIFVLEAFESRGALALGMSPAGPLDNAELYAGMGRTTEALRLLREYVEEPKMAGHAEHLRRYPTKLGHSDLAARVAVLG